MCPDYLYGRKVVATPVRLECEVCVLKSKSTTLEFELKEGDEVCMRKVKR